MGCATAVVAWWCLTCVACWPFKFRSKNEHSEGGQKQHKCLRWSGQGGFLFVRFQCERTVRVSGPNLFGVEENKGFSMEEPSTLWVGAEFHFLFIQAGLIDFWDET